MKIRDLARHAGSTAVNAWPPRWGASFQPRRDSVMRHEDDQTLLRLTMRFDAREHTGILTWDGPPLLATVERLLEVNLGREIRAIGEVDC